MVNACNCFLWKMSMNDNSLQGGKEMFLEIKDLKKGFGSGDSRTEVLFCGKRGILRASWTVWFWKIHTFEYYRWN